MKWKPNKYRSCVEKKRYGSVSARRAARKLVDEQPESSEVLRPYPCGNHWHVGKMPVRLEIELDDLSADLLEEPEHVINITDELDLESLAQKLRESRKHI